MPRSIGLYALAAPAEIGGAPAGLVVLRLDVPDPAYRAEISGPAPVD